MEYLLSIGFVIFVAGLLLGRLIAIWSPVASIVFGALGLAPLGMLLIFASGGCPGGECIGNIYLLVIAVPVALFGAGSATTGLFFMVGRRLSAVRSSRETTTS